MFVWMRSVTFCAIYKIECVTIRRVTKKIIFKTVYVRVYVWKRSKQREIFDAWTRYSYSFEFIAQKKLLNSIHYSLTGRKQKLGWNFPIQILCSDKHHVRIKGFSDKPASINNSNAKRLTVMNYYESHTWSSVKFICNSIHGQAGKIIIYRWPYSLFIKLHH